MFYVYILYSSEDKKFYIGYTRNLKRRIKQHFYKEVKSTKDRRLLKLIYYEAYLNQKDAKGREKFLKGGSGHVYLKKQMGHYLNENI